jgi:cytochrome c553
MKPFTCPLRLIVGSALLASGCALAAPPRAEIGTLVQACVACHGKQGQAGSDGYFPRLAGKPAGYLYQQLTNFRDGRRRYPAMNYLVAHLSDDYLREMADYFAAQHPPYAAPPLASVSAQLFNAGRRLVFEGDSTRGIPACVACHGARLTGVQPATPGLLGLPPDYIKAQFGAWKSGTRRAAAPDCMHNVSQQLEPQDVRAVAAWLSSQPIPADMQAVPALPAKLPHACGSAPQ